MASLKNWWKLQAEKFKKTDWKGKYEAEKERADTWQFRYNTLARKIRSLGDEVYNDEHIDPHIR